MAYCSQLLSVVVGSALALASSYFVTTNLFWKKIKLDKKHFEGALEIEIALIVAYLENSIKLSSPDINISIDKSDLYALCQIYRSNGANVATIDTDISPQIIRFYAQLLSIRPRKDSLQQETYSLSDINRCIDQATALKSLIRRGN